MQVSAWSDAAELLKARIDSLGLEDVEVVVDRQLNIAALVETKTAKAGAVAVVILWTGCGIVGESGKSFVTRPQFDVRVYASGVVEIAKAVRVDDVIEKILPAVHEWKPTESTTYHNQYKVTGDVDLVPDKKLIIYAWAMECGTVKAG